MAKRVSSKKSSKKGTTNHIKITLRDPTDPDERVMVEEIKTVSDRLWWAWFLGKPDADIKTLAKKARLHVKTVENFVHGITRRPSVGTFVRIAWVAGFRVTLVTLNAPRQKHEVEAKEEANKSLIRHLNTISPPKKRK